MLSFFRKKSESDMTTAATTTTADHKTASEKLEQSNAIVGSGGQINNKINSSSSIKIIPTNSNPSLKELGYNDVIELRETIYDILRTIKDPEKPSTLEDLNVVYEQGIFIQDPTSDNVQVIRVEFNPTVPHCSLATLIGLCIRIKIERNIPHRLKLDIYIKKGAHSTEDEINKQINDKERIAAAMENPNLRDLVEQCIKEEE